MTDEGPVSVDDPGVPAAPTGVDDLAADLKDNTAGLNRIATAMAKSDRKRDRDRITFVLLLVIILITSGFGLRQQSEGARSRADLKNLIVQVKDQGDRIRDQQQVNAQTFAAIEKATSPAAQAAGAAAIAAVVKQLQDSQTAIAHCVVNRVDHDNLGAPLDPTCPPA